MNESPKTYDVIIIGGGPAGLSAGMYAARARLNTLLIERGAIGGQIINTQWVENYPGFVESISGIDLTQAMHQQATKFGLEMIYADVSGIRADGKTKTVTTSEGDFTVPAVIITGGSERQRLGVPGEEEYIGRGVSFCATCDGAFFTDKEVAVVGGGNAALTEALELTKFASKVSVIHRRDELRATMILQEKARADSKIEFVLDSVVDEVVGETFVTGVKVSNVKTGEQSTLGVSGVFMAVGFRPNTDYLKGTVELDELGTVIVSQNMETSVPGIFAAGDIRSRSIRQVIAAAGDGAVAAISAEKYLRA
ncbi:MAG: thioredoxin-disulfide reductase [Dehalococcoidales bacterium]|nr:thioredoxin-disulfide reductase [Dehalococcoidales bacterium]